MITNEIKKNIYRELFSDADNQVFSVIDGASAKGLLKQLNDNKPEHCCLFTGNLHPEIAQTAPYLAILEYDSPFTAWLIDNWGNHFGVFALVPKAIEFKKIRTHCRSFLRVRDPEGKPLFFRYYDPRVMQVFLPTCGLNELKTLFGPVSVYVAEEKDPEVLTRFCLTQGRLKKERLQIVEEEITRRI